MNGPEVVFTARWNELLQSEGYMNSIMIINVKTYNILEDPSTNSRTITDQSTLRFLPFHIDLNLHDCSQEYIQSFFQNEFTDPDWLRQELASYISTGLTDLGYSPNGYILTVNVKITYRTFVASPPSINDEAARIVSKGRLGIEDVKRVETKPCSICLDDLSDSSKHGELTRMTCSHVFHDHCLLKWLHNKNTCPLCRTVLYDN